MFVPDELARWIRGEMDDAQFEQWVYANHERLERELTRERAFELIELDYRPEDIARPSAKDEIKQRLIRDLNLQCTCILMRDRQLLPLSISTRFTRDSPFVARFTRTEGGPNGSELWKCKTCSQIWFVIVDSDDDWWYFERVTPAQARAAVEENRWPATYDRFDIRWPSGFSAIATLPEAQAFGSSFSAEFLFPDPEEE